MECVRSGGFENCGGGGGAVCPLECMAAPLGGGCGLEVLGGLGGGGLEEGDGREGGVVAGVAREGGGGGALPVCWLRCRNAGLDAWGGGGGAGFEDKPSR